MRAEIREARPEDVPSLEIVRRQAIEAGFSGAYDRDDFADRVASPEASLPEWIAADRYLVLVAETDITPTCFGAYDREAGELLALYTAPDYEGGGCATALLERFEAAAREGGVDRIAATAPSTAAGFFEGRGFERVDTDHRDGLELVVLEKQL